LVAARRSRDTAGQDFLPKSLESAAKMMPDAHWTLISVPGRYAAGVSREALRLGKHVFLYSDNVSLEEEIDLKKKGLVWVLPTRFVRDLLEWLPLQEPDCSKSRSESIN